MILKFVRQISSIQILRLGMDGDRINFLTQLGTERRFTRLSILSIYPAVTAFDGPNPQKLNFLHRREAEALNLNFVNLSLLGTSISKLKVDLLNLPFD